MIRDRSLSSVYSLLSLTDERACVIERVRQLLRGNCVKNETAMITVIEHVSGPRYYSSFSPSLLPQQLINYPFSPLTHLISRSSDLPIRLADHIEFDQLTRYGDWAHVFCRDDIPILDFRDII